MESWRGRKSYRTISRVRAGRSDSRPCSDAVPGPSHPGVGVSGCFGSGRQQTGLPLFVLPPCSPKVNGHVERANRPPDEEFYELYKEEPSLPALRAPLGSHEAEHNRVRPHQVLGMSRRWSTSRGNHSATSSAAKHVALFINVQRWMCMICTNRVHTCGGRGPVLHCWGFPVPPPGAFVAVPCHFAL